MCIARAFLVQKSFSQIGRYLDLGLVWKLYFYWVFLDVDNILYRVDNRYIRNGWELCAASLLALLVLQPFRNIALVSRHILLNVCRRPIVEMINLKFNFGGVRDLSL